MPDAAPAPATPEPAAVIEGEAVEVGQPDPATTTTLVGQQVGFTRQPEPGVLMPVTAAEASAAMRAYQEATAAILEHTDWQGRPGRPGSFIKKSGWRKIAKAYRLSCELVSIRVERDQEGVPLRAEAIARAIGPNGQSQDGDGYCSADEKRFRDAGGRQKLENDLRATATTRAKNRAISDLVGFGEVSAEEVHQPADLPPHGPAAPDPEKVKRALAYVLDRAGAADTAPPEALAEKVLGEITAALGGYLPEAAAVALLLAAVEVKATEPDDWEAQDAADEAAAAAEAALAAAEAAS